MAGWSQQSNILNEQSFGRGATVFFLGSGAGSKVLDPSRFDRSNIQYYKSPFFLFGVDHCVLPDASNAYWGLGLMVSSSFTDRSYLHQNTKQRDLYTNTLILLKASHHYAFFVRKKLDMCSGILVGSRIKYHQLSGVEPLTKGRAKEELMVAPAFGISATARYYPRNNFGVYLEVCLGYKTDLAHIGIVYKMRKIAQ